MTRLQSNDTYIRFDNTFYDSRTNSLIDPIETENFTLVQAVDSRFLRRGRISPHLQCCDIELTALLGGTCDCAVEDDAAAMQKNDVHIVFRDETHAIVMPGACRFQNLAFNIHPGSPYAPFLAQIRARFTPQRLLAAPARVRDLMNSVILEFYRYSPETAPLAFDCIIGQTVLALYRMGEGDHPDLFADGELPGIVLNYIDHHFRSLPTAEAVAERTRIAYARVGPAFLETYGVSVKQYLIFKKMDYACTRLRETTDEIQCIGEEIGYSTPFNFSRAFKSYVGLPPTAYRRRPFALRNPLR